ncbi:MAG: 3-keto-5-aminohexanoate cleavage protein [Gemmatimonadaceae bacterium]
MSESPLLEVALNGSRDHPRVPRTPGQLADEGRAAVAAGARVIHMHAFDDGGRETLAAVPTAAAVAAVRRACPGVPISLSTSAAIEPDPRRRLALLSGWTVLPELVTANQGEDGIIELCELLIARGIGIEAGLLSTEDARKFVKSGLVDRCVRVLVEPLDAEPDDAVAHAAAMEEILVRAGVELEQVHHGDGIASWAVNVRALARGHGIRTGLEDTAVLPDGRPAPDNAALVRAAVGIIAAASKNTR